MVVYTSISNEKDNWRGDILCLPAFKGDGLFSNKVYSSKIYKILSHKFFKDDITFWIDGNIFLLKEPEELVQEWLGEADMAVFEHNHHWTIYQEVDVIRKMFKSRPWIYEEAKDQIKEYPDMKLSMCGLIIRRNNDRVNAFNEAWWSEICVHGQRDQLSFPVVLKRFPELKVNYIEGNIKNHPYLRYEPHKHFKT